MGKILIVSKLIYFMSKLNKNKEYFSNANVTVDRVKNEINSGLDLLNKIDREIVTFFGAHKLNRNHKYYKHCKSLARELGRRDFAVLTGGGPGIMHAANSGAMESGTDSLGIKADLLKGEYVKDKIFSHELSFHFLFVRRFIMAIKSEALIFYPGGYGTLNELFEYLVLMQTGIVDEVPIVCINKKYWEGLFDWLKDHPLREDFLIHDKEDLKLLHFVDNFEEVVNILGR
ncbi:TIGR00730 family Rossman fold protein [Candidatus Pacearchaeota archaeon]|jgi:hypothetical protein|nr:TIGR00730 family Rossman fold protein [Candidatus Pacearchaeota archaeon]|tara:strand:+ start:3196 stop:3885 length:690 start_codon:yes stop_codon:yes gene_type:complete